MQNGPLVFIGVSIAIAVFALIVGRLMRRTAQRPMPGRRNGGHPGLWIGHDGDGGDGGGGD